MSEVYAAIRGGVYDPLMMHLSSETQNGSTPSPPTPSNRLGLDYAAEAERLPERSTPIIDVHTHINGREAAALYKRVAEQYGIGLTYSMSQLEEVEPLRELFGPAIRFIAVPNYFGEDRAHHHGPGHIERIEKFADLGVRIAKFWAAPRGIEMGREVGRPDLLRLDSPQRLDAMHAAAERDMMFMVHVADPDTWFSTKYRDASIYGTKRDQYEPLEAVLERFPRPWIAAHMGGWPEDLDVLDGLLSRHDNLYLDTSATKWMVRELSRQPREAMVSFLRRWKGRVLFGSDTVTLDEHLQPGDEDEREAMRKAGSRAEAYDLYASRYWALRTLFETEYDGESPIADPDLAMLEPERYSETDAPRLRGLSLDDDLLASIYHDAARDLLEPWHAGVTAAR